MGLAQNLEIIEEKKLQLKKLQPLKKEDEERLWKKFRLEWDYNSNHIEGNTLTYNHTELLLYFEQVPGEYTLRELDEMRAHDVAIKVVVDLAQDRERDLNENFIRQLNETILVKPFYKDAITQGGQQTRKLIQPGQYKSTPNSVLLPSGEMFHYASPEETPAQMGDLINFYRSNSNDPKSNAVWLAAMMHYRFVRIHPFDDGNGRVARLIMNFVLLKAGLPPAIIKSEDKKSYLAALNKADTGDLEAFVTYIADQVLWSLDTSIKAAKGESIDELGDLDKKIRALKIQLRTDENLKVKTTKSLDAIRTAMDVGIIPLFEKITAKLAEFDVFFKSSIESVESIHGPIGSDFASGFEQARLIQNLNSIPYLLATLRLLDFRKNRRDDQHVILSIRITFHGNLYEVRLEDIRKSYDSLYDEPFSQSDIRTITEELGNYIIAKIEGFINPI